MDGEISDEARRAHVAVYRMNTELREAVRSGVLPSDLYRFVMRLFEEEWFNFLTPQVGHSLGRVAYGPPFLVEGSDRPLEPGIILVVEPTMRLEGVGSLNIEDTPVVTEDRCEVLTSTMREWDAFL